MNGPNLLLDINALQRVQPPIPLLHGLSIVPHARLLATRHLLLAERLARRPVEQVCARAGQPLEVVRHVLRRQVRDGEARVGFGFLFFPAGVEEFDWGLVSMRLEEGGGEVKYFSCVHQVR